MVRCRCITQRWAWTRCKCSQRARQPPISALGAPGAQGQAPAGASSLRMPSARFVSQHSAFAIEPMLPQPPGMHLLCQQRLLDRWKGALAVKEAVMCLTLDSRLVH